jgi:hypothetical protein
LPKADYRAIRTRYVGPTNTKGSRIIADAGDAASRVILEYDYGLNTVDNHATAAEAVRDKMGWRGGFFTDLVGGEIDNTYVWVFLPRP